MQVRDMQEITWTKHRSRNRQQNFLRRLRNANEFQKGQCTQQEKKLDKINPIFYHKFANCKKHLLLANPQWPESWTAQNLFCFCCFTFGHCSICGWDFAVFMSWALLKHCSVPFSVVIREVILLELTRQVTEQIQTLGQGQLI